MHTVVKGGSALSETWEQAEEWIPFHVLVREAGTPRSFVRFPSEASAAPVAAKLGGRVAEVLVQKGTENFEIVLQRPPPKPPQ